MAKVTMTDVVDGVAVDTSSVTVTVSQGASGTDGTDGLSVLNGSGAPSSSLGVNGDFYIDTTAHAIYGPKASGVWGSSTSLIGPAGADGTDGTNGTDGADGEGVPVGGTTGQVLAKTSDTDFDTEWVDQTGGTGSVSSDDITDATTVGKAVLTAADAATARTAIGAGTSSLAIGTTSSTAKVGNYAPAAADISDATTVGKSVLTAADAASARTAIGAGTSSLALGTTATTALAGDTAIPDSPDDIGAATSAQGALADTAVQPADLATVATSGAYSDLSGTPTVPADIDDLSDVDTSTTAPTDGQVLTWVDADSKWEPADATGGTGGATTLDDLTDVDTTTTAPTDGQALVYDSGTSLWVPGTVSGGGSGTGWDSIFDEDLSDITDFTAIDGTWAVNSGVLRQSSNAASVRHIRYNNRVPTAMLVIEVECNMISGTGDQRMGLYEGTTSGGAVGKTVAFIVNDGTWHYCLDREGTARDGDFSGTGDYNVWRKVRIVSTGMRRAMYVDGTYVGSASSQLNNGDASYVGLTCQGAVVDFRNFKVWTQTLPA